MLDQLLKNLPTLKSDRLVASWNHGEDAALWKMGSGRLGILTVDFITPVVDSPRMFGEIAAANALSDAFAMGGRPLIALNIVGFPTSCEPVAVLEEILQGGAAKVLEAGAILAGGHSVQDDEPKYGLVVFGEVEKSRVWQVTGARPGDALLLTKRLGTGLAATAIKAGLFGEKETETAIASMAKLNALPSFLPDNLWAHIHACTDVTGFGLAGHAHDMVGEGNLSIEMALSGLPLLPGVCETANMGLIPAGNYANREHLEKHLRILAADTQLANDILYDPQTSGGLLIAIDPAAQSEVLACLQENGFEETRHVGNFIPGEGKIIVV